MTTKGRYAKLGLCDQFGTPRCARPVLDNLPTALLVIDHHGQIRLANARAATLLDRPIDELMGSMVDEVLVPLDLLQKRQMDDRCEVAVKHEERRLVIGYGICSVEGLFWDDKDEQYVITFQDITRIAELRDERDRLLSITAISEAIPTLLHELKNPFAAVMSAIEVLQIDSTDDELTTRIDSILAQLQRMRLVLDGFSLGNRRLRSSRFTRVDRELLQTFELLRQYARSYGVETMEAIAEMPPLPLDGAVLRAISFNLFINAIDACRDGGQVQLSASLRAGEEGSVVLHLTVADSGQGMSPEVLAHCREVFYTTKSKGSGIGLALCQQVVSAGGGTLEIVSKLGKGTRVKVRIPCKPYGGR